MPSDESMHVYNSSISSGNGWEVYAWNLSSSTKSVLARAVCVSGLFGETYEVHQQGSAGAGSAATQMASCPSGSIATGGGFSGKHAESFFNRVMVVEGSEITDSLRVWTYNVGSHSNLFSARVMCFEPTILELWLPPLIVTLAP